MSKVASGAEREQPAPIGFGDRPDDAGAGGLVSQSATLAIGAAVSAVFAMAYSSLCARWLTPTRFADVTAALSISVFLTIPAWPLDAAITRHAAHAFGAGRRALLRVAMQRGVRRAAKISVLCLLFWLAIGPFVQGWLGLDSFALLALVGVYSVGAYMVCVPRGIIRGDHRFRSFAASQVLEAVARALGGTVLMALGFGTGGAVAGYAIGIFAAFGYGLVQLRDLPRDDGASPHLPEASNLGPVLAFHLYILFCAHVDMLVAKRVLSAHDAGLYGAATTLSRALYLLATPVYQVLFARAAALGAAGESTAPLVRRGFLLLCTLLAASCIVPFALGPLCLSLLFGDSFAGAIGAFRALWISVALVSLQAAIAYVLIATNRAKGFWSLFGPCVILCGLLATYNGSTDQVALSSLGGAVVGLLWCCGLAWIGWRGSAAAVAPRPGLG